MIRLAHAQGHLTQRNLNPVQWWALDYFLRMERRDYVQDQEIILEEQTFAQFAALNQIDRWKKLFGRDQTTSPDGQPELPITDPRQLDAWFNSLAAQKGMSGAQAEAAFSGGRANSLFGQATGEGRKV